MATMKGSHPDLDLSRFGRAEIVIESQDERGTNASNRTVSLILVYFVQDWGG